MDTDKDIAVTIICVAYCQEQFIRKALDSFINQKTDFRYEIIVHDDASPDKTPDIIREYEEKYPDVVRAVYQTENLYSKGIRITDELLLPLVRGKYMAFCEGDDYWCDENKLQKQVDFLEANPEYDVCVHNTRNCYRRGRSRIEYGEECRELHLEDCIMRGSQSFHYSSMVVRTDFYKLLPEFAKLAGIVEDYPDAVYYTLDGRVWYMSDVMSVHIIGTPHSWTKTVLIHHESRADFYSDIIDMLKAANEYSGFKHNELFSEAVEFNEYNLLQSKQDYKKLVRNRKFFKREKLIVRIIYRLFAAFPFLIRISNFIRER